MLNGRLYRAAFAPLPIALAIAGFSLVGRPGPLTTTLAPDAFDGPRAYAELRYLAARFPQRRPGGRGDEELASYVTRTLQGLGGVSSGGFSVRTRHVRAQTIDGERTLTTVVATRPGATGGRPIAILAHRDAAGRGAAAELSGTAVLLELARVFAGSETQRTVIVVSVSGGSGGGSAAADFAASEGPVDGAIVLGDVAGVAAHEPFVVPFSDALGSAPPRLDATIAAAISQEVGVDPGAPTALSQLAHLTLPLTAGEQGSLNAHGMPTVLVQVDGERGPPASEAVSAGRLQSFGRAVLSATYALDGGPDLLGGPEKGFPIQHKVLPEWALRLLLATLLFPPLVVAVDGLARLRRRRAPVGRWLLWALACSLPFLLLALFARLLGLAGVLAAPAGPVLPRALPAGAVALEAVLAAALVLVLAWLGWPALMRRLRLPVRVEGPRSDAAGLALLLVLLGVTLAVWLVNPYTALLLVSALHLWLAVASPEWRHSGGRSHRARSLAVVALGVAPLALLVAFYARDLGAGAAQVAQAAVLLLAGGHFAIPAIVLWSLALGCLAAVTLVALSSPPPLAVDPDIDEEGPITIRGPVSYAGPGSLGGTESALRR